MKIASLVLAAGTSTRMGQPKALLPADPAGVPFVLKLVGTLVRGGTDEVFVIGRASDRELRDVIAHGEVSVRYVVNPDPGRGQLSSLVSGLGAAEAAGADAVLVMPVDMPLVSSSTISSAIGEMRSRPAPIVRVSFQGQHGHPVIFHRDVFDDLRHADVSIGARDVVRRYAGQVVELAVEDPGVIRDFDFPEDYRAVFNRDP